MYINIKNIGTRCTAHNMYNDYACPLKHTWITWSEHSLKVINVWLRILGDNFHERITYVMDIKVALFFLANEYNIII